MLTEKDLLPPKEGPGPTALIPERDFGYLWQLRDLKLGAKPIQYALQVAYLLSDLRKFFLA